MVKTMSIDTQRLITEVRLHPELWDLSHNLYKNRDARLKGWLEVCEALFPNFHNLPESIKKDIDKSVQQRWKTARDAYVRCKNSLKNSKSGSGGGKMKKYIYFELMQFIEKRHELNVEDSLQRSENVISNVSPISENINDSQVLLSTNTESAAQTATNTTYSPYKTIKKKRLKRSDENKFEKEMVKMLKQSAGMLQNDDMAFFSSLLPIIKNFNVIQKLHFRSDILKKAMEITQNNNLNDLLSQPGSSNNSYSHPASFVDSVLRTSQESEDAQLHRKSVNHNQI